MVTNVQGCDIAVMCAECCKPAKMLYNGKAVCYDHAGELGEGG